MKAVFFEYLDSKKKFSGKPKISPKNKIMKTSIASVNKKGKSQAKSTLPNTKDTLKTYSSFSSRYTPKKN